MAINRLTKTSILQSAAAGTGNGNVSSVSGMATAVFTVLGTFSGTVTFETSTDSGSNWFGLAVVASNSTAPGTPTLTTTAPGIFAARVSGLDLVRARVSSYVSGSITVNLRASEVN